MLIGYMRVSKTDGSQVLDLQRDALADAGVGPSRLNEDFASGRRDDRPGLEACLKGLRQGDTLVVWKLDRLGRNLRHRVNLVHDLAKLGAGLKVLAGEEAGRSQCDRRRVRQLGEPSYADSPRARRLDLTELARDAWLIAPAFRSSRRRADPPRTMPAGIRLRRGCRAARTRRRFFAGYAHGDRSG